jgi:protein phosphatase
MSSENEITAEMDARELAAAPESATGPTVSVPLTFAAKTDLGQVRENNEDKFDWWAPEDESLLAARGRLFAVADGMGGHAAGQIAAEMALKTIGDSYFSSARGAPEDALKLAIVKANTEVFDTARAIPSRKGMGCTIVLAAVVGEEVAIAWAGDSRIYRIREGRAEQLTEDHSWVREQVRSGALTEAEAERSPYRNIITRCLGPEPAVTPEAGREPLRAGDILVLCSDGLTGVVSDDDMAEIVSSRPPAFACQDLIGLANRRGGPDNITAAIIRVDGDAVPDVIEPPSVEGTSAETPRKRGWFGRR